MSVTQGNFICTYIIVVSSGHPHHSVTSISFIKVTNVLTSQDPILTLSRPERVSATSDRVPHGDDSFVWRLLPGTGVADEDDVSAG
ncbi:hypothetical protein [Prevotella sp. P3-122]|uniref:hypothetical protein n=1 Tax=Prevotella sp. P3-122 TaxID=2024223 RepID=UPI001482FD56|nr:hypothetical protein [Prevotella sp. P3-122]